MYTLSSFYLITKSHLMDINVQILPKRLPSITDVLKKISDDKSLTLFNSIAVSNGDKYIPLKEMNLTTKQYYSRISGLINAGLIKRHKGKVFHYSVRKSRI